MRRTKALVKPHYAAAKRGHLDVMKLLAKSGVKVDLKDAQGRTALHRAATERDHPDMAQYLVALGLEPNEKNVSGRGAKDYARGRKFEGMLKVMEQR